MRLANSKQIPLFLEFFSIIWNKSCEKQFLPAMVLGVISKNKSDIAFEELVIPELEVLYRTAWSLTRSEVEAQDLVQETLMKAYAAIDRFDGRYPRAWLLTILRNTNINRARKKKPDLFRDPDQAAAQTEDESRIYSPEHALLDPLFDASVQTAYSSLKENAKAVIDLVDLDGFSYQEAADKLNLPLGTVMSRLHRARKHIRETLLDIEVDGDHS